MMYCTFRVFVVYVFIFASCFCVRANLQAVHELFTSQAMLS